MVETTRKKFPFLAERLRISPDGTAQLLGIRCNNCSRTIFPGAKLCPNCGGGEVEEVPLSARGRVWTYTIVHMGYGSLVLDFPYVAAFVELDDGAFVHAPIVGCEPGDVGIGTEVELTLLKAGEGEEGDAMVYAFRPVDR